MLGYNINGWVCAAVAAEPSIMRRLNIFEGTNVENYWSGLWQNRNA